MFNQLKCLVNTGRQFMRIVCYIDQRLARAFTELLNDGCGSFLIADIQSVQRFIQDNQIRIFYKGSCQ